MQQSIARKGLLESRQAVTTLEYALIAALMMGAMGVAAQSLGTSMAKEFRTMVAASSKTPASCGNSGLSSD